jgi:hypothetical protein
MLLYLDPDPRIPLDSGPDPDLAPALYFRGFKMLTKNNFLFFACYSPNVHSIVVNPYLTDKEVTKQ